MASRRLGIPSPDEIKNHVLLSLSYYWPKHRSSIENLPVPRLALPYVSGPLKLVSVALPNWAQAYAVDGSILVPQEACHSNCEWQQVDWWLAMFLLQECWHEREWEQQHCAIHSYSYLLKDWDTRAWDYAWVNRIALFLRSWVATNEEKSDSQLFGPLPDSDVLVTHDVDAIRKTLPIRIKQAGFNVLNAGRHAKNGQVAGALKKIRSASRFMFGQENWWTFDTLLELEQQKGINAHYNFYADTRRKNLKRWLFDPGYDINAPAVKQLAQKIIDQGGEVGLHPSFDAWASADSIRQQKLNAEQSMGVDINSCRQHWLRFSWEKTWSAQQEAGLLRDTTLMFNDRPGFRAASAFAWQPWDHTAMSRQELTIMPTVMMDSHFYDYQTMEPAQRNADMSKWIDEVKLVCGNIAVLWHPHTLTKDYGWSDGFYGLVDMLQKPTQHLS
ncbi:hypothetical protein ACFL2V_11475 [Pseudomonadota bacterium]